MPPRPSTRGTLARRPAPAAQAAVVDVRWALAAPLPVSAAEAAPPPSALQLYSLSADGTLLLWGPLPQPLPDLFPASKGHRGPSGAAGGSWAPPASQLAAALGAPLDVGAQLAAAGAGPGAVATAAACFGAAQPTLTALAVARLPAAHPGPRLAAGAPISAAAAAPGSAHLLAVAARGGAVAVLRVTPPSAGAAGATSLELLWAAPGGGSPVR